jgi:hypothetical protein
MSYVTVTVVAIAIPPKGAYIKAQTENIITVSVTWGDWQIEVLSMCITDIHAYRANEVD